MKHGGCGRRVSVCTENGCLLDSVRSGSCRQDARDIEHSDFSSKEATIRCGNAWRFGSFDISYRRASQSP